MNKILLKIRKRILRAIDKHQLTKYQANYFYQKSLKKHLLSLPTLPPYHSNLLRIINKEGVAITTLDKLGITSSSDIFTSAQSLMFKISQNTSYDPNQFVIHATPQQIIEYQEIFLWGLDQDLLNLIENFLGLPVAYQGIYFRRDIANQLEIGSRLWHIDQEDRKVLKIIIYLNDVNEDNGPFQYIPKYLTSEIEQSLQYRTGYVRDNVMQGVTSSEVYKSCTGIAKTVIIADTSSIFHRGKPPINTDRFTIFYDYTSRRHKQAFHGTSILAYSDLHILSKNLSEKQKRCIFW
ncbi:2OG-Fe(II) oxygenase [Okeanomitos corallinicola TIOX110]|uniref:2OG-Fe(II) oxygenase n=1 Tax=Okeanomitos corallinicola TIOX110 TaxID=3133117 RepID=A0ABZ2UMP1_9CYAN